MSKSKVLFYLALSASIAYAAVITDLEMSKYRQIRAGLATMETVSTYGSLSNRVGINLLVLFLILLYVIWLVQAFQRESSAQLIQTELTDFRSILMQGLPFLICAFVAYPFSADIYIYLHYGLMVLDGLNPFLVEADLFSSGLNDFHQWLGLNTTAAYAPLSIALFVLPAFISGSNTVFGIYCFKLLCLAAHVTSAYLIWRFISPSRYRQTIVLAYLIHPLILIQQISDCHTEVFVAVTIVAAIACIRCKCYSSAVLCCWAGALIKTLPILYVPLISAFLLSKRLYASLALVVFASLRIVVGLSSTILPTLTSWKASFLAPELTGYSGTLLHVVYLLMRNVYTVPFDLQTSILQICELVVTLLFAAYYTWQCLKLLQQGTTERHLVVAIGWVTLTLILFARPWVSPWYVTLPLAVVVFCLDVPVLVLASFTYSLSVLLVFSDGAGQGTISIVTSLSRIVPPTVVLLSGWVWRRNPAREFLLSQKFRW